MTNEQSDLEAQRLYVVLLNHHSGGVGSAPADTGEITQESGDSSAANDRHVARSDVPGFTQPGALRVEAPANKSTNKERFGARPDFEPPQSRKRLAQSWTQCPGCSLFFAAPTKELARGRWRHCSIPCAAAAAIAEGRFKGDKNPRWLGGVSNDNMRYRNRQKLKEPEKEAARAAVSNAVRAGRLIRQPCEVCGATRSAGHHDDYSRPLDVRWLCRTHHDELHAKLRLA